MSSINGNGNVTFYRWALALLTALLVGSGSWGMSRITSLQEQTARQDERVAGLSVRLDKLDIRLDRIDNNLGTIKDNQQRMVYLMVSKDNPALLRQMFPAPVPTP